LNNFDQFEPLSHLRRKVLQFRADPVGNILPIDAAFHTAITMVLA
jgi:hypothetical protein